MSTAPNPSAAPRARHRLAGARCVVTGGLGFIGSAVVHRLVGIGASVVVVDSLVPRARRRSRQRRRARRRGAHRRHRRPGRRRRGARRRRRVQRRRSGQPPGVDAGRRCATSTSTSAATSRSSRRCATSRPTATVVQTSTRQVYGKPQYLPVDEEHPTAPVDVNGIDKLACEQFHLLYGRRYDMPRDRAPADQRLRAPPAPRARGPRLPARCSSARPCSASDIVLYGDGTQRRDCVHVDDVVEALLLSATTTGGGRARSSTSATRTR